MTGHTTTPTITEADFQAQVIHLARLYGWLVHHTRPAQNRDGTWSTPITGDVGFPDLVLAHPERGVLFLELKTETGAVSEGQRRWLRTLKDSGAQAWLVRPGDLLWIAARLRSDSPVPEAIP